jgi:hypothetical protein
MGTVIQTPIADDQAAAPAKMGEMRSPPDALAVQQALDEILSSTPFCHTQQCQSLLRYVVKHTLAQEEHLLRERVIGAEVFGRKPDYETGDDPVVRIRASEVRKRLAQFYEAALQSGSVPEVHISIPSGSYRATFRWRDGLSGSLASRAAREAERPALASLTLTLPETVQAILTPETALTAESEPAASRAPVPAPRKWFRRIKGPLGFAFLFVALAIGIASFFLLSADPIQVRTFKSFWRPWSGSVKPVIISVGSNAVYRLSETVTEQYGREHNMQTQGLEFFVPFEKDQTLHGSDLTPAYSSFVALGDVEAISNVVATLTRQNQPFQERFPNDVSFAELSATPTILVGGFNNPMTIELTKSLPFVLSARNQIVDSKDPRRHWKLRASEDSHDTEDFAIVTRLAQNHNDAPMMSVAGMGQYGTLAAAKYICNPASVSQLAGQLPRGWEKLNLQFVLHVRVLNFKPESTDVVAIRTWQ